MDFARVLDSSPRFWPKVRIADGGCWLWIASRSADGYGNFQVKQAGKVGAHRVAWALTNGRWPTRMVLHRCGNPPCVRPDHLYEGGARENAEDARRHGTMRLGERHGNAKLTDGEAQRARERFASGETASSIARDVGVSARQVRNIVSGLQRGGEPVQPPALGPRYRLVCQWCGSEYYRKPGARRTRFCSRSCSGASQRRGEPSACVVCGEEFYRPPSAKGNTCSYRCMGRLQSMTGSSRGERSGSSKVTDAQRDEIRRRREAGDRVVDLAREFNLSRDQIARYCRT